MIKRVVEIGSPARIHFRRKQLVVEPEEGDTATIPLEDLGVLVLDHPQITHSQAILAECAKQNVAILLSDEKHLPVAMVLPLSGHTLHSKTVDLQAKAGEPAKKRLWQAIIRAKIQGQARVLALSRGDPGPLPHLAEKVRSGDPDNLEGQAARYYWSALFGESFRRERDAAGINSLLNYGYAVIRAAVARAIVGTGLHPSLGIHHRNKYNSLCLADDLMEPLRPLVDWVVYGLASSGEAVEELTRELKTPFLELLNHSVTVRGQPLPLLVALQHYAAAARKTILGEEKEPYVPDFTGTLTHFGGGTVSRRVSERPAKEAGAP